MHPLLFPGFLLLPLLYLDQGALSQFRRLKLSLSNFKIVYSDAHVWDLQNDQGTKPEIAFLQSQDAVYASLSDKDNVIFSQENVAKVFQQRVAIGIQSMGELISFLHGGGADRTAAEHLVGFFDFLDAEQPLMQQIWGELSTKPLEHLSNVTNRDIERSFDKSFHQVSKLISSEDANVLCTVRSSLDADEQKTFDSVIPRKPPSIEGLQTVIHVLSMLGLGRSKKIRKRNDNIARQTGRHDYIDALHIAYGLHCHAFATNDKATATKFRLLNEYWVLGRECLVIEDKKGAP